MQPFKFSASAHMPASPAESPLRFFVAQRMVGVPTLGAFLQALVGIGLWIWVPPLLARWLAKRRWRRALHAVERWWARQLRRHLAIQLDIDGLEHIVPGEQYIVTPLHEGFADIVALLHLPLDVRFVARDELIDWQVLGPYLRDTGQICVCPEFGARSYRHLLRTAQAVVAQGESIILFPQGTILGIETDFHRGAFALARALSRPILPVALTGSHRVWEHPYTPRLRYGQRISLRVLPPIPHAARNGLELEQLRQAVQRQLKSAALAENMAPPRRFVPERDGYWDGFAYRIDPDFSKLAADVAAHRRRVAGPPANELDQTAQHALA